MLNNRLAIVEDEAALRAELIAFFEFKNMQAVGFPSAEDFFKALIAQTFDLVILDIGLPDMSGIEAAEIFRQQSHAPILILTSHANHETHLDGLNAGADVFLSKTSPLEIIESSVRNLLARAHHIQTHKSSSDENLGGQRKADQALWRLFVNDRRLQAPNHHGCVLTFSETFFLKTIFDNRGQVVSRNEVLRAMAKEETLSNLRNLDTYANRLRRKVFEATSVELPLRSAYNLGYNFSEPCYVLP